MANDLFGFEWRVARGGYSVVSLSLPQVEHGVRERSGRFLYDGVDPLQSDPDRDYRSYYPLQREKTLFRKFARLDGSEESIIRFACAYGYLGGPIESTYGGTLLDRSAIANGGLESVDDWQESIRRVQRILKLWDAYEARNLERVELQLEEMKCYLVDSKDHSLTWAPEGPKSYRVLAALSAEMREGDGHDPYAVTRCCLWQFVNAELASLTRPELVWDAEEGRFAIQIIPSCLLGAIWLQIARAISGDVTYRECEACGNWFVLHPDTARSDKRFCNNACRNRVHRRRKRSES